MFDPPVSMNDSDFPSDPGRAPPRRNLLRHHEQKREREQESVCRPAPTSESVSASIEINLPSEEASSPSAVSLKQALARANLLDEPHLIPETADSLRPPPVSEDTARSSLPLALAKANESRKFPAKPLQTDGSVADSDGGAPTLLDWIFRFHRFADRLHPLGAWGSFLLFYGVTVFTAGHSLALRSLPVHPGVRLLRDSASFRVDFPARSLGIGLGLTLLISVLCLFVFRLAKGRPPFFWVLKTACYALAPLTLIRIYFLLGLTDSGLEAYLRGYRPGSWGIFSQIGLSFAGIWSAVRIYQSASSRHCQARPRQMVLPLGVFLFAGLGVMWGTDAILYAADREALAADLAEIESRFQDADPRAAEEAEALATRYPGAWSHVHKVQFYRLRGELRYLAGDLRGAREDMIRLVRMHPGWHPQAAYGRAVNFLLIGEEAEGQSRMADVYRGEEDKRPDVLRWLYRIHRGDFGDGVRDAAEVEPWARLLLHTSPGALHLEMALDALQTSGQNRRVLRELAEAERMAIPITGPAVLSGALAALSLELGDEAREWWQRALRRDPDLAADPRAEPLVTEFTSRP